MHSRPMSRRTEHSLTANRRIETLALRALCGSQDPEQRAERVAEFLGYLASLD